MIRRLMIGSFIGMGMVVAVIGLTLTQSTTPTYADPALHGTPDPNATPVYGAYDGTPPPTYYQHVAPIVAKHCLSCHAAGGIGYSELALDTPEAVVANARDIAFAVGIDYMPPWMPGGETPPLQNERKLTDDEIAILAEWARTGAALGDPDSATPLPEPTIPKLRQDMVLMMPEPYESASTATDDYRCFLLDPEFTEDTYITGYTMQPGQPSIVHHVILYQIEGTWREQTLARDAADEGLGWECFGGPGLSTANRYGNITLSPQERAALRTQIEQGTLPEFVQRQLDSEDELRARRENETNNMVGLWAPGSTGNLYPEGTGMLIPAGNLIVMQVHYNLVAGVQPDQTSAVLQLESGDSDLVPLSRATLSAPVEIPCPTGNTAAECDRETIIADPDVQARNDDFFAAGLLYYCGKTPDDYINQDGARVSSDCDRAVTADVYAVEVIGHMHERGQQIVVELNPDTPDAQVLLDIPAWDFHWQGAYQFQTPILLEEGDTVRVTCTWSNTTNPRYVIWGEGTQDEMCLAWLTIVPQAAGEALGYGDISTAMPTGDHDHHDNADHNHAADHGAMEGHSHEPILLTDSATIPSVTLEVLPDAVGGWNVQVITTNFRFAPDHVNQEHILGEGHAHLYVNGEKVARLYGDWYHLDALPVGTHEIRVTLNANNHAELMVAGEIIADTVEITVTE